jgi:RHS repeat-associated protein
MTSYQYGGVSYANPDAPTQIANGVSTSTFSYDADGNLIQKTTDGTTTTYVWDYANRLIALGVAGATTTYGYDAFGTRVLQTGTSTTTNYPFKWYSIASSTGSGAKYATTTEYVFNGDTLLSTIDRKIVGGVATGTAITSYIHRDHLGSTNVVTDQNDNLVQTLDYYPYGGVRVSVSTSTKEKRQYIGQFTDDSSLSYLNARYYSSDRGQFISEDPSFLSVGDQNQVKQVTGRDQQSFLADPQLINSYNYGRDNPITSKDPSGNSVANFIIGAFDYMSRVEGGATVDKSQDFRIANVTNAPMSQKVGIGIDTLAYAATAVIPRVAQAAFPLTLWDLFVFTGEKITGRPASRHGASRCRHYVS